MKEFDYELYLRLQEAKLASAWELETNQTAPHTDTAPLITALSQIKLNREQLSLINEQIAYTRTIKWATIFMAGATVVMAVATCVLAFK